MKTHILKSIIVASLIGVLYAGCGYAIATNPYEAFTAERGYPAVLLQAPGGGSGSTNSNVVIRNQVDNSQMNMPSEFMGTSMYKEAALTD